MSRHAPRLMHVPVVVPSLPPPPQDEQHEGNFSRCRSRQPSYRSSVGLSPTSCTSDRTQRGNSSDHLIAKDLMLKDGVDLSDSTSRLLDLWLQVSK